jgi:hypothetical protein
MQASNPPAIAGTLYANDATDVTGEVVSIDVYASDPNEVKLELGDNAALFVHEAQVELLRDALWRARTHARKLDEEAAATN